MKQSTTSWHRLFERNGTGRSITAITKSYHWTLSSENYTFTIQLRSSLILSSKNLWHGHSALRFPKALRVSTATFNMPGTSHAYLLHHTLRLRHELYKLLSSSSCTFLQFFIQSIPNILFRICSWAFAATKFDEIFSGFHQPRQVSTEPTFREPSRSSSSSSSLSGIWWPSKRRFSIDTWHG
jgi:hypothetical protein